MVNRNFGAYSRAFGSPFSFRNDGKASILTIMHGQDRKEQRLIVIFTRHYDM